jgi:hypothetical protein
LTLPRFRAKDNFVKRLAILLTLIGALAVPALTRAQWSDDSQQDRLNPYEYQDVDDGQLLKLGSYVLTPIGMGLEWGLMRPLNYLATQTPLAPVLSGDKDHYQFGQNDNANLVPPETFAAPPVNFSNTFVPAPPEHTVVTTVIEQAVPPSSSTGSQAIIH